MASLAAPRSVIFALLLAICSTIPPNAISVAADTTIKGKRIHAAKLSNFDSSRRHDRVELDGRQSSTESSATKVTSTTNENGGRWRPRSALSIPGSSTSEYRTAQRRAQASASFHLALETIGGRRNGKRTGKMLGKRQGKRGGKGGGKGGGGKASKSSKGGNGKTERKGFSNLQSCALFEHYNFAAPVCPKSSFFCPYVGWEENAYYGGTEFKRERRRLDYHGYYIGKKAGTRVECVSSFQEWCMFQYDCGQILETDNSACVEVIKSCCTGWCDSGLTLRERCDAFEIVRDNPTLCKTYEKVICPSDNIREYVCKDEEHWRDFCHTYSDEWHEGPEHEDKNELNVGEKKGVLVKEKGEDVSLQIFETCITDTVRRCCCGDIPPVPQPSQFPGTVQPVSPSPMIPSPTIPSPSPFIPTIPSPFPFIPTIPSSPSPAPFPTIPTPSPTGRCDVCIPSFPCANSFEDLFEQLAVATDGSTIGICDGLTIIVTESLLVQQNDITFCCDGFFCALDAEGNTNILTVTGKSFALCSLELRNGVCSELFMGGGNLRITGDGEHLLSFATLSGGRCVGNGGGFLIGGPNGIGGTARQDRSINITMQGTFFVGNSVNENEDESSGFGGGAVFSECDTVRIIGGGFIENSATVAGGGFVCDGINDLVIQSSFIAINTCLDGIGGAGAFAGVDAYSIFGNEGFGNIDILSCSGFQEISEMGETDCLEPLSGNFSKTPETEPSPAPSEAPASEPSAPSTPPFTPMPTPTGRCNECTPSFPCATSFEDLFNQVAVATDGSVIGICGGTAIIMPEQLRVVQNDITFCCDGTGGCVLDGQGISGILSVKGESFALCSLELRNGLCPDSLLGGGNLLLTGGGEHLLQNSILMKGTCPLGGNMAMQPATNEIGSIDIIDTVITMGSSTDDQNVGFGAGGGALFSSCDIVTLKGGSFLQNTASFGGGGFAVFSTNTLTVQGVIFFFNICDDIGGAGSISDVSSYFISGNSGDLNRDERQCTGFQEVFEDGNTLCLEPITGTFTKPLSEMPSSSPSPPSSPEPPSSETQFPSQFPSNSPSSMPSPPSETASPSISEAPSASPTSTAKPSISAMPSSKPSVSAVPSLSAAPSKTVVPSTSSAPSVTSEPSTSSEPTTSTHPSTSDMPSTSSFPSISRSPSTSSFPSVQPSTSSKPSASFIPSTQPSSSSVPSTSSLPSELPSDEPSVSSEPSLEPSIEPTVSLGP